PGARAPAIRGVRARVALAVPSDCAPGVWRCAASDVSSRRALADAECGGHLLGVHRVSACGQMHNYMRRDRVAHFLIFSPRARFTDCQAPPPTARGMLAAGVEPTS